MLRKTTRRLGMTFILAALFVSLMPLMAPASGGGQGPPDKVEICHKPGTPAAKVLEVPEQAVGGHLGHGDHLISENSECPKDETPPASKIKVIKDWSDVGEPVCDATTIAQVRTIKTIPYKWNDHKEKWVLDFGSAVVSEESGSRDLTEEEQFDCPDEEAIPVLPTVVQSLECEVEGSITIPETVGVEYRFNGEPISGTVSGPLDGILTAVALEGFFIEGEFSVIVVIAAAEECEEPTTSTTVPPEVTTTAPPGSGDTTAPPTSGPVTEGTLPFTGIEDELPKAGLALLALGSLTLLMARSRKDEEAESIDL